MTAQRYITIVHDLTYEPSSDEALVERDGLIWLNTYRAPAIEVVRGDASPLEEFLAYLIPNDAERTHLLRVMAWTIRNPGEKVRHAILIRSEHQGIGKSMLAGIWSALLGASNSRTVSSEEIASDYQGFLQECLLNVVEELALGSGRQFYNRMKDWITGDLVRVNEKHLARREWRNLVTFLIFTNLKIPILVEDKDRRIFMIDTPAEPRSDDYYLEFASWWKSNLGVVRAYFEDVDLQDFNPYAPPPFTEAKRLLIADSRTDLEKDLGLAIQDRSGVFSRDLMTLDEVEKELGRSMTGKSKTQLTAALNAVGAIKLGQKWVGGSWLGEAYYVGSSKRRVSLWAIRNTSFWQSASAQDCDAEYGRRTGFLAQWEGPALEFLLNYMSLKLVFSESSAAPDPHFNPDQAGAARLSLAIEHSREAAGN